MADPTALSPATVEAIDADGSTHPAVTTAAAAATALVDAWSGVVVEVSETLNGMLWDTQVEGVEPDWTVQRALLARRRRGIERIRYWSAVADLGWRDLLAARHRDFWPRGMLFSCGDGWREILERLFAEIEVSLEVGPEDEAAAFQVSDVKEKYGSLRVYHNGGDVIDVLVDSAEQESLRTCERCGRPGALRKGGWLTVACDEHAGGRDVCQ